MKKIKSERRKAIVALIAAYEQQRQRRPLKDDDTIAVFYGDLRKLIEAEEQR